MNNDKLIKMFKDLSLYEESLKRHFPAKAYLNAIASIKKLGFDITDPEQLKGVSGFGKGLIENVDSFLKNNAALCFENKMLLRGDFIEGSLWCLCRFSTLS